MATNSRNRGGITRVLQKLNKSIEEGNFYEAHQMIRTLYFRYMSQNRYEDATDLVYTGACSLLRNRQFGSGSDLAKLMLDCFQTCNRPVDENTIGKLCTIIKLFEPGSSDRQEFINEAIRWTTKADPSLRFGHETLHKVCAEVYWQEKNYVESRYHFMYTSDGCQCATMLVEHATTRGYRGEADLFVTQAVLQFLCLKNTSMAHVVFFRYTSQHPDFAQLSPPFNKPLLNFVWFLLLLLERKGSLSQFTVLCEKYQPSIERDPEYKKLCKEKLDVGKLPEDEKYLDRIGQLFFGLPPQEQPRSAGLMGGLLGDLVQSLMRDEEGVDIVQHTEDLD